MWPKTHPHLKVSYSTQFSWSIPFENNHIVQYSELKVPSLFWKLVLSSQNSHFLKIDLINLIQDIHHWKAESHSFPTVCGTILENFIWYNVSFVNRWLPCQCIFNFKQANLYSDSRQWSEREKNVENALSREIKKN